MKLTADKNNTRDLIFKAWESKNDSEHRPHLGASIIGKKCERHLWFTFRWALGKQFPGRILKLFNRGHLEEQRFTDDLRSIGVDVRDVDPDSENPDGQWHFEAHGGHFGGSGDGIAASGIPEAPKSPHILEYKTHGDKPFKDLVAKGVEKSKPEHFAQCQTYMGLSGKKWGAKNRIERALYMAVNKNTDDLHCERIRYDKKIFDEIMDKAERIIFSPKAPEGISSNPQWYECKFCDHYDLCFKQQFPEVNCRTCAFSTPERDGSWNCDCMDVVLSKADQKSACGNHLINPSIVDTWLIAIDGTDESIVFERKDNGRTIINGFGKPDDGTVWQTSEQLFSTNERMDE